MKISILSAIIICFSSSLFSQDNGGKSLYLGYNFSQVLNQAKLLDAWNSNLNQPLGDISNVNGISFGLFTSIDTTNYFFDYTNLLSIIPITKWFGLNE